MIYFLISPLHHSTRNHPSVIGSWGFLPLAAELGAEMEKPCVTRRGQIPLSVGWFAEKVKKEPLCGNRFFQRGDYFWAFLSSCPAGLLPVLHLEIQSLM